MLIWPFTIPDLLSQGPGLKPDPPQETFFMKKTLAFRRSLATLSLLTACSAASAALVTVDTNGFPATYSEQTNQVVLVPTISGNTNDTNSSTTGWAGSSVTHLSDLASLTRASATSTADSSASGVVSQTLSLATFTTASSASVVANNNFTRTGTGTIRAKSTASIDNRISFTVNQLSDISWSATFSSTANASEGAYFELLDGSSNLLADFGCTTGACTDGTIFGSGQLAAGLYFLNWGGSVQAMSETLNATVGTAALASAGFSQSGTLTLTAVPVPVPAAAWLFGSAVAGFAGLRRRTAK
jgi:hypothetical protein